MRLLHVDDRPVRRLHRRGREHEVAREMLLEEIEVPSGQRIDPPFQGEDSSLAARSHVFVGSGSFRGEPDRRSGRRKRSQEGAAIHE